MILHFATGHVLEEQAVLQSGPDLPADISYLHQAIRDGDYPHLAEARDHLTGTGMTELFEQGLRVLTAEVP
ncbi:TetR/AcrR family transcriptional regulator C-terminal domain-containing protein [Amycolatopsis circi]|uniref:TetR/AcrR family transcriptional regulator C-terminal domain-containing protein n=1 Tax=Amycolatopsis circi TaxID=871959 RepID=UPI001FC97F3F|nr:TetR/AcrR family transcriptional regulator C-terminal domain-containing protein [Amycolatopsis circi]